MNYSIKQLKALARESLRGHYGTVICALLLYFCINFLLNFITNLLFQDNSVLTAVISFVFTFALSLIMCIFSAGLDAMYLRISRKQPVQVMDLFYLFHCSPDRAIVAGFVQTLLSTLCYLPVNLAPLFLPGLWEGDPDAMLQFLGILLLSLILSVLLSLPFSFIYFLLAENPDMSAREALRISFQLAGRHFGALLFLECSFLGLTLLSAFTMYIALLFVVPYMRTSVAFLYRDARGEFSRAPDMEQQEDTALPSVSNAALPGDDFNSEA